MSSRFWARFVAMVDALVGPKFLYAGVWPGRVVSQGGDGTLEVQPDDPRIPGLTGVPIRYGLPGTKVLVPSGARCRVGFEGGDPSAPYAFGFDEDADFTEITIGSLPHFGVARATIDTAGPYPITGGSPRVKVGI